MGWLENDLYHNCIIQMITLVAYNIVIFGIIQDSTNPDQ